ncbi:MAG: hypothetical protein Q4G47_04600, partial [Lachnospiraceae bacterium]|nr:hypothetical protein [Lachnospiraceae bacterium]
VNAMMSKRNGYCGVFGRADGSDGTGRNGYSFVIGSRGKDCREACRVLREAAAARGGGKADMVQGQAFGTREEILEALGAT